MTATQPKRPCPVVAKVALEDLGGKKQLGTAQLIAGGDGTAQRLLGEKSPPGRTL